MHFLLCNRIPPESQTPKAREATQVATAAVKAAVKAAWKAAEKAAAKAAAKAEVTAAAKAAKVGIGGGRVQGFSKFSGRLCTISGNGRANIFQIAKGGAAFQN